MGGSIAATTPARFPSACTSWRCSRGSARPSRSDAMPARVATWLDGVEEGARASSPKSYASVDEAAARIAEHDPLVTPEMARFLAEKGTTPALGGRIRFKHDPLHATPGPYGFSARGRASSSGGACSCPTLIVDGAQSMMRHTPAEEARRAQVLPARASAPSSTGAGHMMQRHQPQKLGEILRGFLLEDG